ncbi:MAG TPA: hypothetical protein PKA00_12910 [Saprospiraceae bacterium]|nr:hypothetical protein [Saprospiraceae bacterium]HMQ83809.1 hypothetical protein [Saprospiraceae bacterium]
MRKALKRIAIVLLVILVLVVGAAALMASLFEDKVGRILTKAINEQLTTQLQIQDFELSIITTFPNVAANFKGVGLEDARDGQLLEAEELSFRFGLWSLFGSNIKVRSVVLSNGALYIQYDKKGNANYDIFKPSDQDAESNDMQISLESARLKEVECIYENEATAQTVSTLIKEASFSGQFSSEKFAMNSQADLEMRFLDMGGQRYLAGNQLHYDARINVDFKEEVYKMEEVFLTLDDNTFKVDGVVESWETGTYFDLYAVNDKGSLGGILSLLPKASYPVMSQFNSTGNFQFNVFIKGQSNAKQNPEIRAEFSLDDGAISSPLLQDPLKDVRFKALFSNGKFRDNSSSMFKIEDFRGFFNRERIEMRLAVDNLDDPQIDFFLDGALPLNAVYGLLGNPKITAGTGEIEIQGLTLKGRYQDMIKTSTIDRAIAKGGIEFDDAGLTINEEKMLIDRGQLVLDGNLLSVKDLKIEGAGSDIAFEGTAFNIVPVFFADSVNSQGVALEFSAQLHSDNLDLDRLMSLAALSPEEQTAPEQVKDSLKVEQSQKREAITSFLKGTFNASVDRFNYQKIEGQAFKGALEFDNSMMSINGQLQAMEGSFVLDSRTYFETEPYLVAKLDCKAINVTEFFRQTDNFGQEVLQDKHLKGKLDSKMAIYAFWDAEGNFLMDKLRVLAGIGIHDGELIQMPMLEQFSAFVKLKDLQHVKFTDLENYLEIRKEKLYIPVMFIRSNALNLTLSGEHTFENDLKYNIKVNAGQVVADRLKRHDSSLSPRPAKQKGWFNLYYQIAGNLENYDVKSAKKSIKSDFELSEIRKREIRRALEEAFGYVEMIDEPDDWRDSSSGGEEYLDFDGGE